MLDEIAAEAAVVAEMQTQVEDIPTAVDSMEAETIKNGWPYREEIGSCDGCRRRPGGMSKWSMTVQTPSLKVKLLVVRRTITWGKRIGDS